ncbi:MAG: class I SAM-dependent methyltransferase, partial [Kiritimatiellia bacterium]|nr:class I SAM-dependent methyltransferase [Kiritimatiellia bacterium]
MPLRRYADCARLNGRLLRLLAQRRWVGSADVARSYDRLAPAYDQAWLCHLQSTTERLLARLPTALPEGPIFDLGCGTGFAARQLAEQFPGHPIEACDLSPGMIAEARARSDGATIRWQVSDLLAFLASRPPASAALLVAAWSAGYTDFRRVVREGCRTLRPGGGFALVVNLADTLAPLRRAFRYCMQAHSGELQRLARFPFPRDA